MTYSHLFTTDSVLLDMDHGDADAALGALADALVLQDPALVERRDELHLALQAREARGSTGSQGVGIPHVKLAGLDKVSVVIGVHHNGLDFNALDGENVYVLFSVVRPEVGADEHLDLLRWIAGLAQHQDFVSFACQASSSEQVLELLSELSPAG